MSECRRCANPLNDEYFPLGGHVEFVPFDILAVIESAHNPVEQEIFNKTMRPAGISVEMFTKRTIGDSDFEGRPAIALDFGLIHPAEGELVRSHVLITATYWGQYKQRRRLPLILQRFGVGIYQHATIAGEPGRFHLHTSPEWTNSSHAGDDTNAWLIARVYPFEGKLAKRSRWENVNRADRNSCSSFTVEEEFQDELQRVLVETWDDWIYSCEFDPKTLERNVADYKKFSNKLARYKKQTGKQGAQDPPMEMIQKQPIRFAHALLARPIIDESVVSANLNALELQVQPDDITEDNSTLAVSASAPIETAQASDKTAVASDTSAGHAAGPSAPPPKMSYAEKLKAKAGATSSQSVQKPARQMVPA
ncbi:hypothetical protein L227DRAFT_613280 [Lentinus tigrinus ALCF2SS1-6]|uniref:Uncharacterized protein n=1 Tax=Lentinus tigrinus ALCF2SS1-6 TaxID=1328759 RepID=A0A5C2S4R0_9APHY|nr:hypothetical protein L227DRAFT_613280 [Lentinus tigrinus ALCF2SS1-6]